LNVGLAIAPVALPAKHRNENSSGAKAVSVSQDVGTEKLLQDFHNHLQNDDAREAFSFLLNRARADTDYRFVPRAQGALKRTVQYLRGGSSWPYGFIVNLDDLLFYYRAPSRRTTDDFLQHIASLGLDVSRNKKNELKVRIRNRADAEVVYQDCFEASDRADTSADQLDWSDEELKASVASYRAMQRALRGSAASVNKREVYRGLSARFGRTEKAFEFRMQNISAVLALLGRDWLPGLKPAAHVGKHVAERIERFLNEADGMSGLEQVGFDIAVREKRRKQPVIPPAGAKVPTRVQAVSTSFVRDPAVKAWVLDRANGSCENCNEPAPFMMLDGQPFLEVHHLRRLADEGSDRVSNAVALCPNCHRRLHYGADAARLRASLLARIPGLAAE
jgi:HNH endonuclease